VSCNTAEILHLFKRTDSLHVPFKIYCCLYQSTRRHIGTQLYGIWACSADVIWACTVHTVTPRYSATFRSSQFVAVNQRSSQNSISVCNWQMIVLRTSCRIRKEVIYWNSRNCFDTHRTFVISYGRSEVRECWSNLWKLYFTVHDTVPWGQLYSFDFILYYSLSWGARGGVVVKGLRYKPAGHGFDSRWCHFLVT
jgi:hypothetical protein